MLSLPLELAALRELERERANERERRAIASTRADLIEIAPAMIESVEVAAR